MHVTFVSVQPSWIGSPFITSWWARGFDRSDACLPKSSTSCGSRGTHSDALAATPRHVGSHLHKTKQQRVPQSHCVIWAGWLVLCITTGKWSAGAGSSATIGPNTYT